MERVLQYLDDLDDLVGAFGLLAEKIRQIAVFAALACAVLFVQVGVILLALVEPPLALATALLLFVRLLYRFATQPGQLTRNAAS